MNPNDTTQMTKSKVTYRITCGTGNQGAPPPVGSQAGVEKYATGSGTVSMPSKHPLRHKKSNNHPQKESVFCCYAPTDKVIRGITENSILPIIDKNDEKCKERTPGI